jgi:hypothetical protein
MSDDHLNSTASKEPPTQGPRIGKDADWTEVEEGLTQIEYGISALYGLWDAGVHGAATDARRTGEALFFIATQMERELKRTQKALGYRAGGKPEETDTN